MNKIKFYILFVLAINAIAAKAGDDVGLWMSADAETKITKAWSIGVGAEYRLADNISSADRWSVGIDTEYKLAKWLKVDAGYEFMDNYSHVDAKIRNDYASPAFNYWQARHRFHASAVASWKPNKRWTISLRERWQYTYRPSLTINGVYGDYTDVRKSVKGKGENVLRSRLEVSYNIKKSPFEPYVSCEMYNTDRIEKMRYAIGTEYKITKQHNLKFYYLYQDKSDDDERNGHVIGLSYGFKF